MSRPVDRGRPGIHVPSWVFAITWHTVNAILWLFTGFHVTGRQRVPRNGPLLIVCNHLNNVDPLLLGAAVPRPTNYMAKIELFRIPVLSWLIRQYGAFPIDRGNADRQALKTALQLVAAGQAVSVFPEGTRSRTGGLRQGLVGTGMLVARSGATVLPVAIRGSERSFRVWPRPTIQVAIGEPRTFSAEELTPREYQHVVDTIMTDIARLLPPPYRGHYAARVVEEA